MGRDRGSPNIKTMSDSILLLNERRIRRKEKEWLFYISLLLKPEKTNT